MTTPDEFVLRFQAVSQRIQREAEGWTAVTREYTESMDEINEWLTQQKSLGKGEAALGDAPDRLGPIYRKYAVGMESGSREVTEALQEARRAWEGSEDLWNQEPPQETEELRNSLNALVEASHFAAHTTQGLRDSTKVLVDATGDTDEATEAIEAAENALSVCDEVIGFGDMALGVLDQAAEQYRASTEPDPPPVTL